MYNDEIIKADTHDVSLNELFNPEMYMHCYFILICTILWSNCCVIKFMLGSRLGWSVFCITNGVDLLCLVKSFEYFLNKLFEWSLYNDVITYQIWDTYDLKFQLRCAEIIFLFRCLLSLAVS